MKVLLSTVGSNKKIKRKSELRRKISAECVKNNLQLQANIYRERFIPLCFCLEEISENQFHSEFKRRNKKKGKWKHKTVWTANLYRKINKYDKNYLLFHLNDIFFKNISCKLMFVYTWAFLSLVVSVLLSFFI